MGYAENRQSGSGTDQIIFEYVKGTKQPAEITEALWDGISHVEVQKIHEICLATDKSDRLEQYPRWICGCFLPIVTYCCTFLARCCQGFPIHKTALTGLGEALTERFALIGRAAAMQILFAGEKKNRKRLSEDKREDIWLYMMRYGYPVLRKEYGVLARMLEESILVFLKANVFFIDALKRDWNFLRNRCSAPDYVAYIYQDMKELHKKDKNVHIAVFDNGEKVVFKQERGESGRFWRNCCRFMQEEGIVSIFCPWCEERDGYLWEEYVRSDPARSKQQKEEYYYHAGELLCLLYLLHATDMHRGNVIWHGVWPVVIDTETVCNGKSHKSGEFTVRETYLLPSCKSQPYIQADFAALANGDGETAIPHVQEGFAKAYHKMMECDRIDALYQSLEQVWLRYVLHPTWIYARILDFGTMKLAEKGENACFLDGYRNLLPCERESLEKGYLPVMQQLFDSMDLYDEDGNAAIKNYFAYSPKDAVRKRIENLTDRDLEIQLGYIQECFAWEGIHEKNPMGDAGVCI